MKKLFLLLSAMLFTGCSNSQEKDNMTVEELSKQLNDTNVVVLDVRTPEELIGELGALENIINIPVQEIDRRYVELDTLKNKKIAVVCRSGNRSRMATNFLKSKGFDAVNVEGGMIDYRSKIK